VCSFLVVDPTRQPHLPLDSRKTRSTTAPLVQNDPAPCALPNPLVPVPVRDHAAEKPIIGNSRLPIDSQALRAWVTLRARLPRHANGIPSQPRSLSVHRRRIAVKDRAMAAKDIRNSPKDTRLPAKDTPSPKMDIELIAKDIRTPKMDIELIVQDVPSPMRCSERT
jgi:hypothetical protein